MFAIVAPKGTNLKKIYLEKQAVNFYASGLFVERKKLALTYFIYYGK